jgi:alpha-beta hydrolase superfamily lysophospholipase
MSPVNPLDDPRVAGAVFFPRPDMPFGPAAPGAHDHLFEAEPGIDLRLRVFPGPKAAPTILFFHGNGETGRDYDPIAAAYNALPVTFVVAEYRGYGPAGGEPSLSSFLGDAQLSLDEIKRVLETEGRSQQIVVMGRSLGSGPAIELAAARGDEIAGLVIESGFARILPLLELLGIPTRSLGIEEEHGPRNADKIAGVTRPTLLIHAENDQIIPIEDAEILFEASGDPSKELVRVPGAGHNDIQLAAGERYFKAIEKLLARI